MSRRRRIATGIAIAALVILVIVVVGFLVWAGNPAQPMPEAVTALDDTSTVDAGQSQGWYTFTPTGEPATTGFIFYPGGLVDPRAYAPMAQALADAGYLSVIVPMPLNLAVFNPNAAAGVIAAYPEIEHWVVGGHSLGGTMAAQFAAGNPDTIDGLVLLASYPANNISDMAVPVLSIHASNDGLSTVAKIDDSKANLPADTEYVLIEGGNHAQFGYYGAQSGDNPATISREDQQQQTVAAIAAFLSAIQSSGS